MKFLVGTGSLRLRREATVGQPVQQRRPASNGLLETVTEARQEGGPAILTWPPITRVSLNHSLKRGRVRFERLSKVVAAL